jgi:hypothetical protein
MNADIIGKYTHRKKYHRAVLFAVVTKYTGLQDIKDLQKNPDQK